jgi:hypothetical protein
MGGGPGRARRFKSNETPPPHPQTTHAYKSVTENAPAKSNGSETTPRARSVIPRAWLAGWPRLGEPGDERVTLAESILVQGNRPNFKQKKKPGHSRVWYEGTEQARAPEAKRQRAMCAGEGQKRLGWGHGAGIHCDLASLSLLCSHRQNGGGPDRGQGVAAGRLGASADWRSSWRKVCRCSDRACPPPFQEMICVAEWYARKGEGPPRPSRIKCSKGLLATATFCCARRLLLPFPSFDKPVQEKQRKAQQICELKDTQEKSTATRPRWKGSCFH